MKERIIAKRYADAFAFFAKDGIGVLKAVDECKSFKALIKDMPELANFLRTPGVSDKEKSVFIDTCFKDNYSGQFRQFLKLLISKHRIRLFPEIAECIRMDHGRGEAVDTLVISTYMLDLEEIKRIESELEKKFNSRMNFYLGVDGDLLGGLKAVISNTIVDGSIKNRLMELKKRLKMVRVA